MLYIYVSLPTGARYCKYIVQRCFDCVLTTMALDTQTGVSRVHIPIEIPA